MEKLKAYYFTGTGNTRYVTEKLCGYLQDRYDTETFDVTKTASVSSADLLLFAFPVYGSSPPMGLPGGVLSSFNAVSAGDWNKGQFFTPWGFFTLRNASIACTASF